MVRALVRLGALLAAILLAGPVHAIPYWIAWEGNDFPENQGWTRFHGPNGAQANRTLLDGAMTIDGIVGGPVYDFSRMWSNGAFDADPGELFIMQWRMRVDAVEGPFSFDAEVGILTDTRRLLAFPYSVNAVRSGAEPGNIAFFEAGVFHRYELRSADMSTYQLLIDGAIGLQGAFVQTVGGQPNVGWGDSSSATSSRTTWDYFRFGVVPEPRTYFQLFVLGMTGLCWSRVHRRM